MKRFGLCILLLIIPLAVSGCGWTIGGAPILASPPNLSTLGCSGTVYTFVWGAVPNATRYVLEVYNNATGIIAASVVATATTADVTAALLTCGGVAYRWRVGAVFTTNPNPAFSGFLTFTVQ